MKRRGAIAKRKEPRFRFLSETINELKKVTWLKWPDEVLYLTVLVILATATVGLVIGIIDYGFTKLVNNVFLGG